MGYWLLIETIRWAGKCKANQAHLFNNPPMASSNSNILFLSASSRPNGHTHQVMKFLSERLNAQWIDLGTKSISYYDYEHENKDDDFLEIAELMVKADFIMLGTPVYWYSMSAQMKTFLDRWSDLLTIRKDLGRALKGKQLALLSCGSSEGDVPGFDMPIEMTAKYMEMNYAGYFPTWMEDGEELSQKSVENRLNLLAKSIQKHL